MYRLSGRAKFIQNMNFAVSKEREGEGRVGGMEAIYFLLFNNNKLIVYQMCPLPRSRLACETVCSRWSKKKFVCTRTPVISLMVAWERGLLSWDNLCLQNWIVVFQKRERETCSGGTFKSIGFKLDSNCFSLLLRVWQWNRARDHPREK